ncbi:MFS transporter [Chloroflexota bacterium]
MIRKSAPVLALSIFSSMLGVGIVAPLLPLYAEDMGATGIWLGIIFGSFYISRSIVMPIMGKLSDRRGRKLILGSGLFAWFTRGRAVKDLRATAIHFSHFT